MLKILDVSEYQQVIDYKKVAKVVDGVILRCGNTFWGKQIPHKDTCFEKHYKGFKDAGVPVGAYYYSAADTIEVAKMEAEFTMSLLKDKQLELPIYFDVECTDRMNKVSKADLTKITETYCDILEKAGYFVGVYSYTYFFTTKLDWQKLYRKYTLWLADYRGVLANTSIPRDIWQYTESGRVNGINGNVDLNKCYRDFPKVIKANGLNGFQKDTKKTVTELAKEVINGKWGNGITRKNRLTKAGYNYAEVQAMVNKLLK